MSPAPVPPPLSLPMARVDPPADVQAAVAAALRACHAWQPSTVPSPRSGEGGGVWPWTSGTTEAGVCDMIDNWPHAAKDGSMLMLGIGLLFGLATAALLTAVFRVLRTFLLTRLGSWLWLGWVGRSRLGNLWQVVSVLALSAAGGVFVGSLVAFVLACAQLDSTVLRNCLIFICGVIGILGGSRMADRCGSLQVRHAWGQPK